MLKSLNKFLTSNYTKCKPWGQRRATIGRGNFVLLLGSVAGEQCGP